MVLASLSTTAGVYWGVKFLGTGSSATANSKPTVEGSGKYGSGSLQGVKRKGQGLMIRIS